MLALHLLGPLALRREGDELALPVRKTAALLVLLALGGPAPRPRVAALLWPGLDEATGRRNLRRELARLRDRGAGDAVDAAGDLLSLSPRVELDTQRFAALLKGPGPSAALALWRGPLADGLELDDAPPFTEWLGAERTRWQGQWREAMDVAVAAAEAEQRPADALALLERLLADDPLQERHHRAVMRLYATTGRREAALAQFERCCSLLREELGLAPMAETVALAASLRGHAPVALEPVSAPATLPVRPLVPDELPFVGRERDVAWLEQAWRRGGTLLIEGEGGVGKSRLAVDFAAARGPYALARCRAGDGELPLSSFTRVLRVLAGPEPAVQGLSPWVPVELSRLLPELGPAPPPLASAAERTRFGQACAQAWAAWASGNFDTVVVDDWHLADAASQGLLAQVADGADTRLLLVYRPQLSPEAASLLRRQRDAGAAHLALQPLAAEAVFELVQRLSGSARPERFAALLTRATAGHPFYVAETLRHLVETGLLTADASGQWQTPYDGRTEDYRELPLPASVREAVLGRVRRLPESAQRVLEAAALAEEPFAARLLAPACALSEVEASLALEVALDAQLLRGHEGGGFAFAHDLVQQALVAQPSPARARSVHRRLALGAAAAGAAPAQVAAHHEAGGEPTRAIAWRQRAADDAMRLLALDEAIVQWRRALADGAGPAQALAIRLALMRALESCDRVDEARAEAAELLQLAAQGAGSATECLEAQIAVAYLHARRDWARQALALLDELPEATEPRLRALALNARASALHKLDRPAEAFVVAETAWKLAGLSPEVRRAVFETMIDAKWLIGEFREALQLTLQSKHIAQAQQDRMGLLRAIGREGAILTQLGELGPAEARLRDAAERAAQLGLVTFQRNTLFNLCVLLSDQGRPLALLETARTCWSLSPPMALDMQRVLMRTAFIEAHVWLGEFDAARTWARGGIDDALALGRVFGAAAVGTACIELLVVLGLDASLAPLLALLEAPSATPVRVAIETWIVRAECALMAGDLPAARQAQQRIATAAAHENPRIEARRDLLDAALTAAAGDPAGGRDRLPAMDTPAFNGEMRARALAVRLRIEAALGGCEPATLATAEGMLEDPSLHALAALLLHHALLLAAPTAARREAWSARVERLAASLAAAPELRRRFEQRWAPTPG